LRPRRCRQARHKAERDQRESKAHGYPPRRNLLSGSAVVSCPFGRAEIES
jgi:hypothetical protein